MAATNASTELRLKESRGPQGLVIRSCPLPESTPSIPGLGRVTAVAILIECPEIGTLTRKQIASLAGLAPMTRHIRPSPLSLGPMALPWRPWHRLHPGRT
ncbi:MAG: transposase [Roseovarius sp.]|nr:transposase [Roseovarius sp.]